MKFIIYRKSVMMNLIEKIIILIGKIITTILILIGSMLFFFIVGLMIYELSGKSNLGLIITVFLLIIGLILGIQIAKKSNQIGYITFISKVSSTNELDDPKKVKEYYQE